MPVFENHKLSLLSNYKTGGVCEAFYEPESLSELKDHLNSIRRKRLPAFVLGAGTNSLVIDDPWKGAVVNLRRMQGVRRIGELGVYCEAGVENTSLSKFAYEHSLSGASWMNYLPGFIGGTVRMNARCYGGEISQVVSRVTTISFDGEVKKWHNDSSKKNLFKGYKNTVFMGVDFIIASVELSLNKGIKESIFEAMDFCESDRKKKNQFSYPSSGCVFKNDYRSEVSVPSGLLIALCGLKGKTLGGASVSSDHANFINNVKNATSQEILELSFLVRDKVWQEFGVWLDYEMEVLGELSNDLKACFYEKKQHNLNHSRLSEARSYFKNRQI